jgi:nucleotide-binding universal stress UspA family protein
MNNLRSIVAATDFSGPARHAVERAASLAHQSGAALTLLHAVSDTSLSELRAWLGADHAMAGQLLDEAAQRLGRLANELCATHCQQVQTRVATGAVLDEIGRHAEAVQADLLVVGARGSGFLRRMVLGSTSERLLRRTARPLLVVRQPPHEDYRRALVALDFSPWSIQALHTARRVAPQSRLVLLTAFQVPFGEKLLFAGVDAATIEVYRRQVRVAATQKLHALAEAAGLLPGQWDACVLEGEASQRIVEQERERDCDLVVLGKHGQSVVEDLLLGSVTRHVLAEGACDVLVSTERDA